MDKLYIVKRITKSYRANWEIQEINNQDKLIEEFDSTAISDNFSLDFSRLFTNKKQAKAFQKLLNKTFNFQCTDNQLRWGIQNYSYNKKENCYQCITSHYSLSLVGSTI
tara:strand:- start:178 stop:504 length:327 start_codon:yes stop_codon:yes gene_type:complete